MQPVRTLTLYVIILICICNSQVFPQDKLFARKGTVELSGNISFSSYTPVFNDMSGTAATIFTLAPQIGVFASDGFEIGLRTGISLLPGVSIISSGGNNSTTVLGLFFAPSYNFVTTSEMLFPFLEGQAGYTSISSGSNTNSGFSYGGRAGLKIIAAGHLLLTVSVEYLAITLNAPSANERSGYNYLNIGVGVGGFF